MNQTKCSCHPDCPLQPPVKWSWPDSQSDYEDDRFPKDWKRG